MNCADAQIEQQRYAKFKWLLRFGSGRELNAMLPQVTAVQDETQADVILMDLQYACRADAG